MRDFVILTDSSCDLPAALAEEMGIEVIPLVVNIDEDIYHNYLDGREITFKEFFNRLKTAKAVKTSAVNVGNFVDVMEPLLQQDKDILYLGFSSGLSGTYNAGVIAAQQLTEKYPGRKIYAVDTLCASLGQGLMVRLCYEQKQLGKTIDEVRDYAVATVPNLSHWFTVNDLMFLKRGGRVSSATAIVGTMLSIKPVLHVDDEGHLVNVSTARGRKASLRALFEKMRETGIDIPSQKIYISHGDCEEDAQYLAHLIREEFGVKDILINYIGPVIGAHAGPGTVALFFIGTHR